MSSFRIRQDNQVITLPSGEFVIGRSSECDLPVEDPLISRRHAVFRAVGETLLVEDLGSRNGVKVNHVRIGRATRLSDGDVVSIGGQHFQVIAFGEAEPEHARAKTQVHDPKPDPTPTALGMRGDLVERALTMGKIDEAEKILANMIASTLARRAAKPITTASLTELSDLALRVATATRKGTWLDQVFELHYAAERIIPTATVDELHRLARPCRYTVTSAVRQYLEWARSVTASMGPADKFSLQRVEGLARTLLA